MPTINVAIVIDFARTPLEGFYSSIAKEKELKERMNRGQACDFGSLSSNFPFDLFDTVLKIRRLSHFLSQLIDSGTDRRIISIELVCSLSDRC